MALDLAQIPTQAGGWFKPSDNQHAVAILIEVTDFERQRPTPHGPKDSALCDVTVFKTAEQLDAGTPEVSKGQRIEQTVLARDLATMTGKATLVTVEQSAATKPGQRPAWVWKPVTDPGIVKKVMAYAEQRDAAVAEAMDAAPDFD